MKAMYIRNLEDRKVLLTNIICYRTVNEDRISYDVCGRIQVKPRHTEVQRRP